MTKLLEPSIKAATPAETSPPQPARGGHAVSFHFTLAAEDVGRCAESLDRLSGAETTDEMLHVIYLDTPDHAIARIGLGFGVRRRDGAGKRGGWKRFVELLSPATPKTARRALAGCLRKAGAIDVVARVETQRRLWSFSCAEAHGEARFDRSSIVMNGKTTVLCSSWLACDASNAEFLRLIAEAGERDGWRLSAESDSARAYCLCDDPNARHVTAFAPKLDADMDAGTAFRTVATACFDQFLLNEAAIRAKTNHEAVHQCRVALRRLSACLRFFDEFIGGSDYEALRADFKQLGTYLRNARDLDVMIADVIAPALALASPAGAPALMREIEARRESAHADLVARLCAPASAALFLRFALWLEAGDWTTTAEPKSIQRRRVTIAKYARRKFERMNRKFAERCAGLDQMGIEERHGMRIHAKNLRYDAEFFATLAQGKSAAKRLLAFIRATKTLQTVLGDWNDILMARKFLTSLGQAAEAAPEVAPKAGRKPRPPTAAALKRQKSQRAAANALAQRIEATSKAEFGEKSAQACRTLGKLKPFWTQLG